MDLRGAGGELRWGYHCAARLGTWHLQYDALQQIGAIHADYLAADRFACAQQRLTVRLSVAEREWQWASARLDGETILVMGPPESRRLE